MRTIRRWRNRFRSSPGRNRGESRVFPRQGARRKLYLKRASKAFHTEGEYSCRERRGGKRMRCERRHAERWALRACRYATFIQCLKQFDITPTLTVSTSQGKSIVIHASDIYAARKRFFASLDLEQDRWHMTAVGDRVRGPVPALAAQRTHAQLPLYGRWIPTESG